MVSVPQSNAPKATNADSKPGIVSVQFREILEYHI